MRYSGRTLTYLPLRIAATIDGVAMLFRNSPTGLLPLTMISLPSLSIPVYTAT